MAMKQGVTNECNRITVRFSHVVKTFCMLRIVSFGSGFEVSGRLLNTSWTLMGSELQAKDYLQLLHVHYNQRFFYLHGRHINRNCSSGNSGGGKNTTTR